MKIKEEFKEYLQTLGYSPKKCYELPNTIERIINHFKEKEKPISKINKKDLENYLEYLKISISEKTKQKRSIIQINSYIYALKQFSKFLHIIKGQKLTVEHLNYFKDNHQKTIIPLTIQEIKQLFEVTDTTKYGSRDRAMLTLFYSCGLRRNEGINIKTTDIDFRKNLIFVEKGKLGKQRYVPFTEQSSIYLKEYIYKARPQFVKK